MYSHPKQSIMHTEITVIEAGLIIGEFDLVSRMIMPNSSTSISFSCSSSARCCTDLKIPISDKDILRIEKQGYTLDQIVDTQSPFITVSRDEKSGIGKYYWIKRKNYNNTCRFLTDNNRCEIYDFRPFGCRIFPFSIKHLTSEIVQIRIHPTNICRSVKLSDDPENQKILIDILEIYSNDLEEENAYLDKFCD